ncbi:hypothetical protein [Geothrix sp. 21YS21S-2]|uniref:hypothetical protein n=1 Tax=Geothrix sp. 21YS21S-2 TaxID=3068893 RepID=UPI0027BA5DB6|nr:hypothetical protein [Geothrix sp. 21YS21S-2]
MKVNQPTNPSARNWILAFVAVTLASLALATSGHVAYAALGFGGIDSAQWEFAVPSTLALLVVAGLLGRFAYRRAPTRAMAWTIALALFANIAPWAVIVYKLHLIL